MINMKYSIFLTFIFITSICAEPYLSPNDPFIRNEIRILGDESELTMLHNTWPLDLGGLSSMLNVANTKLSYSRLNEKISAESSLGWSPIYTTIGLSDNRLTSRVVLV